MLPSSVSQYINPDYLEPLPTTLDAKKSPLALLAQTCSSIGKDSNSTSSASVGGSSAKSLIPAIEKKDNDKNSTDKPSSETAKRENKEKDSRTSPSCKPGFRTVNGTKDVPPLVPVSSRSREESSFSPNATSKPTTPKSKEQNTVSASSDLHHSSSSTSARSNSTHSSGSICANDTSKHEEKHKRPVSSPKTPPKSGRDYLNEKQSSLSSLTSTSYNPSYGYSSVSSYGHLPHPGFSSMEAAAAAAHYAGLPIPLPAHSSLGSHSAAAAALAAQSSALAHSTASLKAGFGPSYSPFVTYTRVRTPSGATTLVPVCRDPYCTHCQLTEQNAHLSSTCTVSGCAQCAHEKSLHSLSLGLGTGGLPPLPPFSSSGLLSSMSMGSLPFSSPLFPHSGLGGHETSGVPSVCNWVTATGEQCGKRFSNSEELLQHLRSHTTAADPLSIAAAYDRYGLSVSALSSLHGSLGSTGSTSPSSMRRAYPTSLSPLSSALMGSSRFHPYKSMLNSSAALSSSQQPPSLGPYISPYALLGQRLGSAAVP